MYISDIDGLINNVSNDLSVPLGMEMDDYIEGKGMRMLDSYPSLLEGTEQVISNTGSQGGSGGSGAVVQWWVVGSVNIC